MASEKARAIEAARFLSTKFGNVAKALEASEHPEHDHGRIEWISRMAKADLELAHPREDTEDNRLREHFFGVCRQMGAVVREIRDRAPDHRRSLEAQAGRPLPPDFPVVHPHLLENMTEMGIGVFAMVAPEYEARIRANQDDVRKLVSAYAEGASVTALRELICEAMGWTASGEAVRAARHRGKKKQGVTG
jgi:hypothetical protein